MKNRITAFLLAAAMMAPAASLWASAGDTTLQGTNGSTTGTPAPKVKTKGHHGHHHKKTTTTATATPGTK
jgi:hypothetical protein